LRQIERFASLAFLANFLAKLVASFFDVYPVLLKGSAGEASIPMTSTDRMLFYALQSMDRLALFREGSIIPRSYECF
jgi:hypothetical protein